MHKPFTIVGQRVTPYKLLKSRELRKNQTAAETALWKSLRKKKLDGHRFRRQQVIEGFIVDFYCHSAQLVIEVDGPIHALQQDYDRWRQRIIESRCLTVLRFTNAEVLSDLKTVLHRIRALINQEST